jgi:hypothetical protein
MAEATFSLDLHVLSPPLTFALSQDQTLHRKFEPGLNIGLIATHPGGGAASDVDRFLSQTKTQIFQTWLAIQFSETDRRLGAFSSSGPDGVCRRGMLLIRDGFSFVNGDRKIFPLSRQNPPIRRTSKPFSGEKFYPIRGPGANSIPGWVITTRGAPGKTLGATS